MAEIELLDVDQPSDRHEPERVGRGSGLVGPVVVVLLALGVGWSLVDRDEIDPPMAPPPTSTIVPIPEIEPGVRPGAGPVLGEQVGFDLLVGGMSTNVRRLDLDSGEVTAYDRPLEPALVVAGRVVHRNELGAWGHVELPDSPCCLPEGVRLDPGVLPAGVAPVVGAGGGAALVWLHWRPTSGGVEWHLVDLDDGTVVREVSTPSTAEIPGGERPWAGPEVIGSADGGVYELGVDGYRRVVDGDLVAVGATEVLVRQCDDAFDCSLRWLERATWAPIDRPVPAADLVAGRLVADGSLLAATAHRPALGAGLYRVDTGEIVRSLGPGSLADASVSPDGRWLVRRLLGRIEVVEVATGASTVVLELELGAGDRIEWLADP